MATTFRDGWAPTSQNQIIVESFHDGAFVKAVAKAHNAPDFDYTTPLGKDRRPLGKDGFKEHLLGMRIYIDRRLVSRVVVVGDTDTDHAGALNAIRKSFADAKGYPSVTASCSVAKATTGLVAGMVLLPSATENGCLETLLLKSTLRRPVDGNCIDQWRDCIAFPTNPKNAYDKFRTRAVIAATIRSAPDISLSDVWTKSDCPFDPADATFKWIADFLKQVFA